MFIDFRQRGGKEPVVMALNATQNGIYTPKDGVDGFAPVDVNVAQNSYTKEEADLRFDPNTLYLTLPGIANNNGMMEYDSVNVTNPLTEEEIAANLHVINTLLELDDNKSRRVVGITKFGSPTGGWMKKRIHYEAHYVNVRLGSGTHKLEPFIFTNGYQYFWFFWDKTSTGNFDMNGMKISKRLEAPESNGKTYGMKDGRWSEIEAGGSAALLFYLPEPVINIENGYITTYTALLTPEQKAHNLEEIAKYQKDNKVSCFVQYGMYGDPVLVEAEQVKIDAEKLGLSFRYASNFYFSTGINVTDGDIASTGYYLEKGQPMLVSGQNIKTINGNSILGSGNIEISGGAGGGIADAPADGKMYARQDNNWSEVESVKTFIIYYPGFDRYTGEIRTPLTGEQLMNNSAVFSEMERMIDESGEVDWKKQMEVFNNVRFIIQGRTSRTFRPIAIDHTTDEKGDQVFVFDCWYSKGTYEFRLSYRIDGNLYMNPQILNVQPMLVSGQNIKTINGNSILGEGDLAIAGGSGIEDAPQDDKQYARQNGAWTSIAAPDLPKRYILYLPNEMYQLTEEEKGVNAALRTAILKEGKTFASDITIIPSSLTHDFESFKKISLVGNVVYFDQEKGDVQIFAVTDKRNYLIYLSDAGNVSYNIIDTFNSAGICSINGEDIYREYGQDIDTNNVIWYEKTVTLVRGGSLHDFEKEFKEKNSMMHHKIINGEQFGGQMAQNIVYEDMEPFKMADGTTKYVPVFYPCSCEPISGVESYEGENKHKDEIILKYVKIPTPDMSQPHIPAGSPVLMTSFLRPDGTIGEWTSTPIAGGSGSGIEDAPVDGKQYARQDGGWVPTVSKEYVDNLIGTVNNELNLI